MAILPYNPKYLPDNFAQHFTLNDKTANQERNFELRRLFFQRVLSSHVPRPFPSEGERTRTITLPAPRSIFINTHGQSSPADIKKILSYFTRLLVSSGWRAPAESLSHSERAEEDTQGNGRNRFPPDGWMFENTGLGASRLQVGARNPIYPGERPPESIQLTNTPLSEDNLSSCDLKDISITDLIENANGQSTPVEEAPISDPMNEAD